MLVSLEDAKSYLRVDTSDDDNVIATMLSSAIQLCIDIGRIDKNKWNAIDTGSDSDYDSDEIKHISGTLRIAILYALGYMYEHREEADYKSLTDNLMRILFSVREGGLS